MKAKKQPSRQANAKVSRIQPQNLPVGQADVSVARIQQSLRLRFNPIRNLTPELLSQYLDSFRLGFFRNAALAWEAMERRDTRLQTVAPKRKKSAARHGWEILTTEDSPAALAQKQALEYFYNNLTATTALEPDEKGGMSLLIRQMMDAVGKRYAVHEIVWQPGGAPPPAQDDGDPKSRIPSLAAGLSAQFTFCPLWWFEGTRGKLRYLQNEMAPYGDDMEENGWLVTVGDGLMEACSVAYMFKHMPLKDWVGFSEKFGFPGILGETDAPKDSPEWMAMEDAVKDFANDWGAVTRTGKITLIESKSTGEAPFRPLVDMMNEEMTRLWRGADLGTSSKGDAVGASLQEGETDILEQDDAQMIGETLTNQVSRFVLQYHFGDVPQLAYIKLKVAEKPNTQNDLLVDEFLLGAGAPIAIRDALERYGRPQPDKGEPLLTAPAAPVTAALQPAPEDAELANEAPGPGDKFQTAAAQQLATALAGDLDVVSQRLAAILLIQDPDVMHRKLKDFLTWLDGISADLAKDPAAAHALNNILASGFANGLAAKANAK